MSSEERGRAEIAETAGGTANLEKLPLACGLLDEVQRLCWINSRARDLLQLDADSWCDRPWKSLLAAAPDDEDWPDEGVRWNVLKHNGATLNLRYQIAPLAEEMADCPRAKFVLLLSDAEQLLSSMNEQVASSLLRIAARFVSHMAHEVRNPVAAISGSAQLLAKLIEKSRAGDSCCRQLLAEEQEALCRSITEESNRLATTLARFLLFADDSGASLRDLLEADTPESAR